MRKVVAGVVSSGFFVLLFAAMTASTFAQSPCTARNAAAGEGKFTGQISSVPDGGTMQVTYGNETILVRYNSSTTVCANGEPADASVLARGVTVAVYGPQHRNGTSTEIDANRIFAAAPAPNSRPAQNSASRSTPPAAQTPAASSSAPPAAQAARPDSQSAQANSPAQSTLPRTQLAPPAAMRQRPVPHSIVLTGGTHAQTMQRLHVVRTYALADLRSNSQVTLGQAHLDFRPILNNPKALFNVADKLRALPQHVQVQEQTSELSEVDQGLVIYHALSYRILPGKCSDPNAKAQLASAGAQCFTRESNAQRLAEFSQPGSPRYVADPSKRQAAIAAFQKNAPLADADTNKHIADLRKALADPAQRAAIIAQVGQAEAARLGTLNDDDLKEELINSGTQRYEETMFVPKVQSSNYAHPPHTLTIAASPAEISAVQSLLRDGVPEHGASPAAFPKLLKIVPTKNFGVTPVSGGNKSADLDLGPYYFLTGFTIGNDHEWNWGASVTINWCIVGCSSTYGVQLYAGFNYAFGLRFPIEAEFKYHTVVHPNNSAEANLTGSIKPIEGTVDNFFSAGLDGGQMYDAKEIVAQAGANAGYDLSLPFIGGSNDFQIGADFTDSLPSPYTGGKFAPPPPGTPGINSTLILDNLDLLGGLLNYGVAGGQVLPAAQLNLHSNNLQLTLNDEIARRQTRLSATSAQALPLAVTAGSANDDSHFSIGNPIYNLGFTVTPGLDLRAFVDIDIWSDHWDFPIWFPQLSLDLPPNGVDFACHAGTTCLLDFTPAYNPSTGQIRDVAAEADAADRTLRGVGCPNCSKCDALGSRTAGQPGNYSCPIQGGIYNLCNTMMKNGAVASCVGFAPASTDQILKRGGKCTGENGNYACAQDMMALCQVYLKNQVLLSCTLKK